VIHPVWIVFLFVLGACVGSFLNVVIYRLPRGQSIVFPGSHCPSCGAPIRWHDNIPILSWILLRARCRSCGAAISPRYLVIELLTACIVSGLYVCYYVLRLRDGVGPFGQSWPMFVSHAALLCGLLACSAVDVELFVVPLPVMWVCMGVGLLVAAARPHPFLPPPSPAMSAASLAALVGLGAAWSLLHFGWLQPSFLDAEERPIPDAHDARGPVSVAVTSADGVNPRREILREVVFVAPAVGLFVVTYLVATRSRQVGEMLGAVFNPHASGGLTVHLASAMGSVVGLLTGMAWIWGTRILGTLAFGKEAMGMGDVHILAAVGAVTGCVSATLTFFLAPVFGLLWALYLFLARGRRELPYGPWLAAAAAAVMLFYDAVPREIVQVLRNLYEIQP